MTPHVKPTTIDSRMCYRIRAIGHVGERWQDNFGAMTLESQTIPSGTPNKPAIRVAVLSGPVADQAALLGVINLLYDLGLSLVSVEKIAPAGCEDRFDGLSPVA